MGNKYFVCNEDYELDCCNSTKTPVDLSGLSPLCFTTLKSSTNKIKNKSVVQNLIITVTAATGSIKTSLIDGSAVTFVSASGSISGSSEKYMADHQPVCLADDKITPLTIDAYIGKGSHGKLTVVGTNTSSGASVTDICDVWFKKAGQDKVEAL